jgi:hypothetical protein
MILGAGCFGVPLFFKLLSLREWICGRMITAPARCGRVKAGWNKGHTALETLNYDRIIAAPPTRE